MRYEIANDGAYGQKIVSPGGEDVAYGSTSGKILLTLEELRNLLDDAWLLGQQQHTRQSHTASGG
jgi:hypothetical protein